MEKKHAYLIMAHNQFDLLELLIFQLDDERNDIYIHIDKSIKDFDFQKFKQFSLKSDITFIPRINVKWGGYSQIQCELALLTEASKKKYSYYHLLSGADFPLKTQDEIHSFFGQYDGVEFVHFSEIVSEGVISRISKYHFFQEIYLKGTYKFLNIVIKVVDKIFIKVQTLFGINRLKKINLTVKFGSQWFSITDDFANYILSKQEWIKDRFSYSNCADELFLQTLIYQSPFKKNLAFYYFDENQLSNMRKIEWSNSENISHPIIWTVDNYKKLIESNFLFARKFDLTVDSSVVEKICADLDNRKNIKYK